MPFANRQTYYKTKKVDFHGRSFGSQLEAAVYGLLLLEEKCGEISDIKCQVHVTLFEWSKNGKFKMIPDFSFYEKSSGETVYAEAKGWSDERWIMNRKHWFLDGPGRLRVYKGSAANPKLVEEIIPERGYHQKMGV